MKNHRPPSCHFRRAEAEVPDERPRLAGRSPFCGALLLMLAAACVNSTNKSTPANDTIGEATDAAATLAQDSRPSAALDGGARPDSPANNGLEDLRCASGDCGQPIGISIVGTPELVWDYTAGNVRCAIPDSPVRMWKDHTGRVHALVSHSDNFRLSSTTTDGRFVASSVQQPRSIYVSPRDEDERSFNGSMWLEGLWTMPNDGRNLTALAHHEWWHPQVGGHDGCVGRATNVYGWVNGVHHFSSNNGGTTFTPTKPASKGPLRMVLAPEPYGNKPIYPNGEVRYGFMVPSNIVHDGTHFYAAVEVVETVRSERQGGPPVAPDRLGFGLIRTTDITHTLEEQTWQIFDGQGWTTIGTETRIGQPHLFTHDPAHAQPRTVIEFAPGEPRTWIFEFVYSLTYNTVAKRWLLFGYSAATDRLSYTTTASLAQPRFDPIRSVVGSSEVRLNGSLQPIQVNFQGRPVASWHASYPSLIDPDSPGRIFMYTGNSPYLYYIKGNAGLDRDIYRLRLQVVPASP